MLSGRSARLLLIGFLLIYLRGDDVFAELKDKYPRFKAKCCSKSGTSDSEHIMGCARGICCCKRLFDLHCGSLGKKELLLLKNTIKLEAWRKLKLNTLKDFISVL